MELTLEDSLYQKNKTKETKKQKKKQSKKQKRICDYGLFRKPNSTGDFWKMKVITKSWLMV